MKQFIKLFILTLILTTGLFGQSQFDFPGYFKADNAQLLTGASQTWTNYLSTSDDTSDNWISIFPSGIQTSIGLAREVYLIGVATDSASADVVVLLRNAAQTGWTSSYADSAIGTSNTLNVMRITLKDATVNRMTIYDQIKIGTLFRATGNGFSTGRTWKWYVKFIL
jgi:hypothetical protein